MIRTWQAVRLETVLESGRTRPLLLECVPELPEDEAVPESSDKPRMMVVKVVSREVTQQSLFNEIFGCLLARQLGLHAPEPGLVMLSKSFCEITNRAEDIQRLGLRLAPGTAVGTHYVGPGLQPVRLDGIRSEAMLNQAAAIYAYDMLAQNPDRRPDKPNCAMAGTELIPFDFEMSFSFIYAIGKTADPWAVSRLDFGPRHLFHNALVDQTFSLDGFLMKLIALSPRRLYQMVQDLPSEWLSYWDRIADHIEAIRRHASEFEQEIRRSLAK